MVKIFIANQFFKLSGVIVCAALVPYCKLTGRDTFPKWAKYYDNYEFGFDGNSKTGFMSELKGFDITKKSMIYQIWSAYQHCAFRNMAFNARLHPWAALDTNKVGAKSIEGNTYHHSGKYSLNPSVKETKWYKLSFVVDGKWYHSYFYLIPIGKTKAIYIRFGMKMYPRRFYDAYWIKKLEGKELDINTRYSIPTFLVRIRDYE